MYYISVALILTELFHLEYLNLQSIISRSSDWISINRPSFDSSYREESNDIYYISVALILTELFHLEYLNLHSIISRFINWFLINIPPFDSSYRKESN